MMAVIAALAVTGILTSVIIAEMLRGESAAIMYFIQRGVLRPLKDLLACAERARGGDL